LNLDSISGVVYDAVTNTALAGAQIKTSNPRYAAMTDNNGRFTVKIPATIKTLIISIPNYNTKEVPVYAGNKVKKIYLYPEAYDNYYSDQLTVSGTKRNTRVVNAQKTINIDNYASISVYDQLKKNLSSDIRLSNYSGTPAAGSAMLVRGINSLNANVQPLIVVDGVILDNQEDKISIHEGNIVNTLSSIDVNDIQALLSDINVFYQN